MNGPAPAPRPAIVGLEALTPAGSVQNGSHTHAKRRWKVAAVVPCFNRRKDLELLLQDVAKQDLRGIELWLTIVDNASTEPLSTITVPAGMKVEFVRLNTNSGGSGGFNAGMTQVLSGSGLSGELGPPDFLWWLDSDARVSRKCLRAMVRVLAKRPRVGGVGSALHDQITGHTWEVGGNIVKKHGGIWPAGGGDLDQRFLVPADYLAACSALVRRTAIEKTGLFPDNFIYYDDIDWCVQMTAKTGLRVVGAPKSRAYHPPGNRRFVTWSRYYIARNCFSHIDVMKMGGWIRFRRAMREIPRAVAQAMMGLPELSELHLRGINDAINKNFPRIEPKDVLKSVGFKPVAQLKDVLEAEVAAAKAAGRKGTVFVHPLLDYRIPGLEEFRKELKKLNLPWPKDFDAWQKRNLEGRELRDMIIASGRLITGPTADVAIVPTGWPSNWFRAPTLIQVTSEGLLVRKVRPWKAVADAIRVFTRGVTLSAKIGLRGPHIMALPPAPRFVPRAAPAPEHADAVAVG